VWIDLHEAISRHGADALRYFLLREIPFDGDGDFSWDRFDARYHADLANTLGNLTSRVAALVVRHAEGRVPARSGETAKLGDLLRAEAELEARTTRALSSYTAAFDAFLPHDALAAVWDALSAGNEFVTRLAPWTLARREADRPAFDATINASVRLLTRIAVLIAPVLPTKADELWRTLGGTGSVHDRTLAELEALDPTGWQVTPGTVLFPRSR
jgi:methionyl-tRNA synthetase